MKQRIFVIAVALMAVAFALSAVFTLMSFDRFNREVLLSRYHVVAQGLKVNLDRVSRYGIDIRKVSGVERDIKQAHNLLTGSVRSAHENETTRPTLADVAFQTLAARQLDASIRTSDANELVVQYVRGFAAHAHTPAHTSPNADKQTFTLSAEGGRLHVMLTTPEGEVLQHKASDKRFATVPEGLAQAVALPNGPGESASSTRYVKIDGNYFFPLKVFNAADEWIASVVVTVEADPIDARADTELNEAVLGMAIVLMATLLVYTLLASLLLGGREQRFPKLKLLVLSVAVGAAGQLAAGAVAGMPYKDAYMSATKDKAQVLSVLVKRDVEAALARRLDLGSLNYKHYPWQDVIADYPDLGTVEIRDASGRLVSVTSRERALGPNDLFGYNDERSEAETANPDYYAARLELRDANGPTGEVITRMSLDSVNRRILDLAADGLTAISVSLLIFVESILLLCLYFERRANKVPGAPPFAAQYGFMRPVAFAFLFGVDLAMSFVPLHMEMIAEPMLGLPHEVLLALPVSVEFLFVGIAIVFAGVWLDRSGWRAPFATGIAFAALGSLYSWLAPDALHFIASRAVLGIGYGLTVMACQGFVTAHTDSARRAVGLAQVFAGIYGGSICGSVTGAMLAERLGFQSVFLAGVILLGIMLAAVGLALALQPLRSTRRAPNTETSSPAVSAGRRKDASSWAQVWTFLRDPQVLALVLMSSLPASIAAVGFLNFFSPVYLSRIQVSQSTIGQVLMTYGLCMVVVGPLVSRWFNTIERKRAAIMLGCVLGGYGLFAFDLLGGLAGTMVAVLFLGVAHSLVLSAQSAYLLSLDVTRALGDGKALGLFRSTSRIGQMLGPIVFGWFALGDSPIGLKPMGYVYALLALGFWALTLAGSDRRRDGRLALTAVTGWRMGEWPSKLREAGTSLATGPQRLALMLTRRQQAA
ncbi:MAG: MFS transporter [Gammaproteobacteria bacterium]